MKVNTNNKKNIKKLKASSLTNAVFICVIISVFCGCMVLISHYQNIFNNRLIIQEDLISRNTSGFNYLLSNSESLIYNKTQEVDLFEDNIISVLEKKSWGFYDILICKTFFKKDTVSKTVLVGKTSSKSNNTALYVTDYDKPLKLSGNTRIVGDIIVPNASTSQAYINGKKGNNILLKGKKLKSNNKLPKIDKDVFLNIDELPRLSVSTIINKQPVFNSFDSKTQVIDLKEKTLIKGINCKGNFVFTSNNMLEVDGTSKLNDVIVIAPKVKITSGFKGNLQIVAKEEVIVEENVALYYPSSIYVKNNKDSILVKIKNNSKLIGGIVINGKSYNESLKRKLIIEEKAIVVGNIYCYGKTQLKGQVIGSVYTDRFYLKTNTSNYENIILNGAIDRESLPKNFIELPLFNNTIDEKKYAVIKEL